MIPTIALLESQEKYNFRKKICGLYPLERMIQVLKKAGVEKFYLNLSDEEMDIYNRKISKHTSKIKDIEIIINKTPDKGEDIFRVPTNLFLQNHYFDDAEKYFKKEGKELIPVYSDEVILLKDKNDFKKGRKFLEQRIIDETHSFFAKHLNKRISLPISTRIAYTRINPNILTFLNLIFAILTALLLVNNEYWSIALGGIFFQLVSINDGVDGEVARFTFKVSKFGGWFDTFVDYMTLLLFIIASSYLFFIKFTGAILIIFPVMFGIGLILHAIIVSSFIKRFNVTGSINGYETDFLVNLPKDDKIVRLILFSKFIAVKSFYSLLFCIICLAGGVYFILPIYSSLFLFATILLTILNIKYLYKMPVLNK